MPTATSDDMLSLTEQVSAALANGDTAVAAALAARVAERLGFSRI
jgi:hypothetical protein